jgi:hypothetical protein
VLELASGQGSGIQWESALIVSSWPRESAVGGI